MAPIFFVLVGCNAELMINPGTVTDTPNSSAETINSSGDELDNNICIDLNIKVFLEGPYNTTSDEMDAPFNNPACPLLPGLTPTSGSYADAFCPFFATDIPAGQPYDVSPWFYSGTEGDSYNDNNGTAPNPYPADVMDWILVSIRKGGIQKGDEVFMQAGLLMKDGTISFVSPSCFKSSDRDGYSIVVEHRNHLRVMTPSTVSVVGNGPYSLTHDFTTQDSYKLSGTGQQLLEPGVYGMSRGDLNQDGIVQAGAGQPDRLVYSAWNGNFNHYGSIGDVDLSGDTNGDDLSYLQSRDGVYTDVPN